MKRILVAMGDIPPPQREGLDLLRTEMEVDLATHLLTEDELVQRVKGVNVVWLGAPKLTRRVIQAADSLEIISRGGIGELDGTRLRGFDDARGNTEGGEQRM